MTIYAWPQTATFRSANVLWGVRDNSRSFESELSGAVQTASLPGTRWACTLTFEHHTLADRPALESFLAKVRQEHRIAMPRPDRQVVRGTINQTGVTLGAAAAQFAGQLTLAGCGANKTLLAGSMIGLPGYQLFMAAEDATSNAGGVMVVPLTHRLRSGHASGVAVTLVQPQALWMLASNALDFPRARRTHPGLTVELLEDVRGAA